ncbi:MAG: DUF5009 domain-containing protein [Candidatus Latescibacteria bacterium]|jgi:heparan-alpha-glucosaminide N-acetyltransferase|nr:DUF5009 domain-containing protein [Candidatus Latescibacterota bacterium]
MTNTVITPNQTLNSRIDSVDIMRGLTILAMVFVNDLADFAPVINVPQWLRHMEPGIDGFTFVDMIMPVFMFILGISIPLALGKRLARNEPLPKIAGHVLIRVISLIIMGLMDVNRAINSLGRPYGVMQDWPHGLWKFLAWTFIFIVWLDIPLKSKMAVKGNKIAKIAGLVGLVWLAMVFRTTDGGTLTTRWWGTLGQLGWAYLFASLTWFVFRNNRLGIIGVFVLLHSNFLGMSNGLFQGVWIVSVIGKAAIGTYSANAIAGLFIGTLLVDNSSPQEKIRSALGLSLFAFIAAMLLRPVSGIHSPATGWSLCATSCGSALWTVLYWCVDVRGWKTGLGHICTVGKNSLLIYQLSRYFIFLYWLAGLTFYETLGENFATGITRAIAYTIFLGTITVIATKKRILLRV